MKYLFSLIFIFSSIYSNGGSWNSHSAKILEKGRWELGLFQPLRYGYSEFSEFSVHPGFFFIMPNIEIKESQISLYGFKTASQYRIIYPTLLLKRLSGEGIGMLIAPEHDIPHMLSFSGSFIGTKDISGLEITMSGGLDLGIVLGDLNPVSSIDLPLVYHRLGVYYNGWGVHSGVDIQKALNSKLEVFFDLDLILLPGYNGVYSIENKFLLSWNKSNKFKVTTGFKSVYGDFPYGEDFRILPYFPILESWVPIIELQWAGYKK